MGYTIGANTIAMQAAVATLNGAAVKMEAAAGELEVTIEALRGFWHGDAQGAFDGLTKKMRGDFDASNYDLRQLAGMVDDFNINLIDMDKKQAQAFLG